MSTKNITLGFSLVELVVVITIIAILTLVGAVSYRNVVRESRDQKRIVNLQEIRSDLELYRSGREESVYPMTLTELTTDIPPDPQTGTITDYVYTAYASDGVTACDNITVYCRTFILSSPLEHMGASYVVRPNSEDLVSKTASADGLPKAQISKTGGTPDKPSFSAFWYDDRPTRRLWIGKCDDANCRIISQTMPSCPIDDIHLKQWSALNKFCTFVVTTQGLPSNPYNFSFRSLPSGTYAVGVNHEVQGGGPICTGNPTMEINGCVDDPANGISCYPNTDWLSCNPDGAQDYVVVVIP